MVSTAWSMSARPGNVIAVPKIYTFWGWGEVGVGVEVHCRNVIVSVKVIVCILLFIIYFC